MSTETYVVK